MTDTVAENPLVNTVRESRLTVTHDGDDYVIGRPASGIYVSVPEPGAVIINALNEGQTLASATAAASAVAGEQVDAVGFLVGLAETGMLAEADVDTAADGGTGREIKWIYGISQSSAARLFGPMAWSLYGGALVLSVIIIWSTPAVRPQYSDIWFLDDRALATLAAIPMGLLLSAVHEIWHWLAGRAVGVPATFRLSHRGPFLTFETDLTQIVSLPRRRRYGPFLAGMAIDIFIMGVALGLRLASAKGWLDLPLMVDRLLAAVVFMLVLAVLMQWLLLFLRSDGYAVLANALRCHNLYRATALTAKRRLLRLTPEEVMELEDVSPHDRAVARWFSLVYCLGLMGVACVVIGWTIPFLVGLSKWIARQLSTASPGDAHFWTAIGMVAYVALYYMTPLVLAIRERRLRAKGRLL